ncbi:uncharacterized protein [Littorina saxatilis]|uniref:uncharacterized protein n=1 Tax=Littorina saxatilis TaxID=31220 RepID=UPI0038B64BFE
MGVFTLLFALVAPLLLINLLPQHKVTAIEITFADPPTGSDADAAGPSYQTESSDDAAPGENSGRNQSEVLARNSLFSTLFGDRVTQDDMMSVVCDGLQNTVTDCGSVPTFRDYMGRNRRDVPGGTRTGRKRRFANSFGSFGSHFFGPSFNSFDPWPNTLGSTNTHVNSFNTHPGYGGTGGFNQRALICPSPQDQSFVYQFNPDSTGYPAALIGQALLIDPVIRDCLTREIVLESDPPTVIIEPFRLTANATCPFTQLRLYSYQSQAAGSLCWIMQNFQELVLYRVCSERFCMNCKNKNQGFGSIADQTSQKLCITDYRTESVWAFCPSLIQGQQIIRDRIIVPIACNCQSVRCEFVPLWKK